MYNLEIIKKYYENNLIKRDLPLYLKQYLTNEDLFIIDEFGLPNVDEFSFSFDENIYRMDEKIVIGKRVDLEIYLNINDKKIYQSSEKEGRFLASSILILLKLIYIKDFFTTEIWAKQVLGTFYENRKKYADYLRIMLHEIDNNSELIDDYENGYIAGYFASFLEQLEFGGI